MYKKERIKNEIIKKWTFKKWTYKEWTYKKKNWSLWYRPSDKCLFLSSRILEYHKGPQKAYMDKWPWCYQMIKYSLIYKVGKEGMRTRAVSCPSEYL